GVLQLCPSDAGTGTSLLAIRGRFPCHRRSSCGGYVSTPRCDGERVRSAVRVTQVAGGMVPNGILSLGFGSERARESHLPPAQRRCADYGRNRTDPAVVPGGSELPGCPRYPA